MLKTLSITAALWASLLGMAHADGEAAGDFDYYVLALSWSPSWCQLEGEPTGEQCQRGAGHGFIMHGLWPQYERGWPQFCKTAARDPSRRMTREMADIMGSSGLAWYQWKKHGRCSGLSAADYYTHARAAYETVNRPEILRRIERSLQVAPTVIEEAFLEANPDMVPDGVTVTCKQKHLQEVRICLTKDLEPRSCTGRTVRDCNNRSIAIPPIR